MNKQSKLEHLKGRYGIVVAIITVLGGGLVAYFLASKNDDKKESQQVKINTNQNSPITGNIHTQNNFYGVHPDTTDRPQQAKTQNVKPKTLPINTNADSPQKQTSEPKAEAVNVNANNALIVTNNQSGGSNSVNIQQVPKPVVKLENVSIHNEETKEIEKYRSHEKVMLPSPEYNYPQVYKTQFTISYNSQVNLNEIGFWIKRDDVLHYDVTHAGKQMSNNATYRQTKQPIYILIQPENGHYKFTIYTVNKFGDPMEEFNFLND